MAFTPQSFSIGQVLTAAQMNTMDGNIDDVRAFGRGTSFPTSLPAGGIWNDTNPGGGVSHYKLYDGVTGSGTAFLRYDETADTIGIFCTGVMSLGGAIVPGARVANYLVSGSLAQSASLVIVPDAAISEASTWDLSGHSTTLTDGTHATAHAAYRGAGTPNVQPVLVQGSISFGYTATSGFWIRNLNASTATYRAGALRRA